MRIIGKYGFVLFLAFAVIYVYAPPKLKDVANLLSIDDITAAVGQRLASARPRTDISPVDRVAAANVDEDLDYQIAERKKSADGWRSFLTAHPNGPHAQSARAELGELGSPRPAPAPPAVQAAKAELPETKTPDEARSPGQSSPESEVAKDPAEPRPAPAPPAVQAAKAEPPETKTPDEAGSPGQSSPESEVARGPADDEPCKDDEDRLRLLSGNPTSEEGLRLLAELRCEKLRPELFRLTEHLDYQDPRAAAHESHSSKIAQAWRARRRAAEPHDRARLRLASRSLQPRRRANRVAAHNLPPILMALFGESPRNPTLFQQVRAGGGPGGGGATGGAASAAAASGSGGGGSGGGGSGGGGSGGGGSGGGGSGGGGSGGGGSGGGGSGGGGSGGGGGGSGGGGGGSGGGSGGGGGGGGSGGGGGGGGSGGGGSGGGGAH